MNRHLEIETAHTGGNRVSRESHVRTLARNDLTMTNIVHQPLPAAIGHTPSPLPDFSDTARWGLVEVKDSLNAPRYEPGDLLHVDLRRNYFAGDACYAVEIAGQQSIRFIQARPGGLHVYTRSNPGAAYPIPPDLLVILGMVIYATTTRRVG